jgi:hypothetical protein
MGEKKKYFIVFVTLFAFLLFVGVGISSAIPIKWNTRKLLKRFSRIPAYNNTKIAMNELSNSSDLNSNETVSDYSDLVYDLNPNGSYDLIPPGDGGSGTPLVPEPATIILMGGGLISMLLRKKKRGG